MDEKLDITRFIVSLFVATAIWYASSITAYICSLGHVQQFFNFSTWYSNYAPSFYDGFQQHFFYIVFILLTLLIGFFLRIMKLTSIKDLRSIVYGTICSILFIPIAATGLNGIAVGTDWPSMSPPALVGDGFLWCLPGLLILIYVALLETLHFRK